MPVATQIKTNQTILVDGEPYRILKVTHITPGKGNAVVQTDLRNIRTGIKTEKRFRSSENVEMADLFTGNMQYLYETNGLYHFMNPESYEQIEIPANVLGDAVFFLIPETVFMVDIYEGRPIGVTLPARVTLTITETDPAVKGEAGKTKRARLETGLEVKVPLFLAEGDRIVVNTETREYVEKA